MKMENALDFAKSMDAADSLARFRDEFYLPVLNEEEVIYFAGNSLGLQPHAVQDAVLDELENWASFGIEGYTTGRNPWMGFHKKIAPLLSELTGASESEIAIMNQLTANLHLMMATFYRPSGKRKKILYEHHAFSSDRYVMRSQMELHGVDADMDLVEVMPREGEYVVRNEDIIGKIRELGDELALVLLGGVNYHTGQVFYMKSITKAAHEVGAMCGFDLAHAVGNVPLQLHEWNVDFAVWCSYKYLNSGPGGVGGVFIHERHATDVSLARLQGWWGVKEDSRFDMEKEFQPAPTAEGWQLSIAPVMSLAIHHASLKIFAEAGFQNLLSKSEALGSYLIYVLGQISGKDDNKAFEIITPLSPGQRGCQLSLKLGPKGKHYFDILKNNGVIASWKEPDIIRIAPVPLYNTFQDIFYFGKILEHAIHLG